MELARLVFGVIHWMIWIAIIGAFLAAALIPKTTKLKGFAVGSLLALVVGFYGCISTKEKQQNAAALEESKKLQAMFRERCEKAGEFIHRTVKDVDGLFLMKLRPTNYSAWDKNSIDPYGYDFDWGDDNRPSPYITTFLIGKDENGYFQETAPTVASGYRYVEAINPKDGKRYRYTGSVKVVGRKDPNTYNHQVELKRNPNFDLNNYAYVVDMTPTLFEQPRYGVTFDDITTPEERDHWIAASSLRVIDLKTNEVIAERIGYMIDFAQGATPGGRQPWTFARKNKGWSCPELNDQSYGARRFVEKVLLIRGTQPIKPLDANR